jgi:hypothetical protein
MDSIIHDCHIPEECKSRYIENLYKGKWDALDRGNYRGLTQSHESFKKTNRAAHQGKGNH